MLNEKTKVIILGFDGMDPRLTRRFMAEGVMPNFQKLSAQGSFSDLKTTNPAESPVAWSAFSIGANPAKTGVYDFLRRIPGTYYPEIATVLASKKPLLSSDRERLAISAALGATAFVVPALTLKLLTRRTFIRLGAGVLTGGAVAAGTKQIFNSWVPKELPLPVNNRKGDTFWKIANESGIPVTALRVPIGFPAEDLAKGGKMLSGLGVPDIRQTQGTFTVYSTKKSEITDTEMGGKLIAVNVMGDRVESRVLGPQNFTIKNSSGSSPEVTIPFIAKINRRDESVEVTVQGKTQTIKKGTFSDFFKFDFPLNPLISISGIAKFALLSTEPDFTLYLAPINFNPAELPPTVRISTPKNFAPDLARDLGLYKTLGWQGETWALNELQLPEELFLWDLYRNMADIEKILISQLERRDARLTVCVFEETDRAQHMFWRFVDETHPLHSQEEAKKYGAVLKDLYRRVDEIVGRVMTNYVDQDTALIVLSDHAFQSFRKAANVNTWLVYNGFLVLKDQDKIRDRNLEDLFGKGEFWPNVDWSRSKAYHLGLGQIYINRFGREPQGIVSGVDYLAVQKDLVEKIREWKDPEDGRNVLLGAYCRQDIYHGPFIDDAPDIVLGFNEGYRISWQSCLGGIPKELITVNDRKWSGDHCSVDPSIMSGIFLSNLKIRGNPAIIDIAPTALKLLGLPKPEYMDGEPLL